MNKYILGLALCTIVSNVTAGVSDELFSLRDSAAGHKLDQIYSDFLNNWTWYQKNNDFVEVISPLIYSESGCIRYKVSLPNRDVQLQDLIAGKRLSSIYAIKNSDERCEDISVKEYFDYSGKVLFDLSVFQDMRALDEAIQGESGKFQFYGAAPPESCINDQKERLRYDRYEKNQDIDGGVDVAIILSGCVHGNEETVLTIKPFKTCEGFSCKYEFGIFFITKSELEYIRRKE